MKSNLQIIAGHKNGKSYLKHCYSEQPFKVANVTEEKMEDLLCLMMTSSSPGILDNDNYSMEINIEEHAKIKLVTQGYQRLFTMTNEANLLINVDVQNNGLFYYLPHPTVPHKSSNYISVSNIFLEKSHQFLWSEIITSGRKLNGEEFTFTAFRSTTNIYLEKKLCVKEVIFLEPAKINIHAIGQMEGFTHQSTLFYIDDGVDIKLIRDACLKLLSTIKEITFGISLLTVNGLVIRIMGFKGEKLFDCNNKVAALIREWRVEHKKIKVYTETY
jgi:urease accessory protein